MTRLVYFAYKSTDNSIVKASQYNITAPSMVQVQEQINFQAADGSDYKLVLEYVDEERDHFTQSNKYLLRAKESFAIYATERFMHVNFAEFELEIETQFKTSN